MLGGVNYLTGQVGLGVGLWLGLWLGLGLGGTRALVLTGLTKPHLELS